MSPCSFNISANARFEELCLFGILIQACGGREGSSLTSFAMPIWFPAHSFQTNSFPPWEKNDAQCSAMTMICNAKMMTCNLWNQLQSSNSQPMPNLSFSPVNARRKRKVRFRCSALHFTHVVCKNQPNKLFEVMVRCATYLGDVWIYHTYMNTHMLYHFMPEDIPGFMWFCPGSLKP